MESKTFGFLGAGNMAQAIIRGLLHHGHDASRIVTYDVDRHKSETLQQDLDIVSAASLQQLIEPADLLVLALKPQHMLEALNLLAESPEWFRKKPLVVSIAAGIGINTLKPYLKKCSVLRAMPNTPALIAQGATVLYADPAVSDAYKNMAEHLFRSVGFVAWVSEENLLDAVTAVSGSGPAYFFALIEALEKTAVALGLNPELARSLTLHTAVGASQLALRSEVSAGTLREQVTSKGGTTEAALNVFKHAGFTDIIHRAVSEAAQKAHALREEIC